MKRYFQLIVCAIVFVACKKSVPGNEAGSETQIKGGIAATSVISSRTLPVGYYGEQNSVFLSNCSGAILREQKDTFDVLTARHCVANSAVSTAFSIDVNVKTSKALVRQAVSFAELKNAPKNFIPEVTGALDDGGRTDLAVVRFVGKLAPGYRAAHFVTESEESPVFAIVAGFGMRTSRNARDSGKVFEAKVLVKFNADQGVIRVPNSEVGACPGDSGGPMFITKKLTGVDDNPLLIGVLSRGLMLDGECQANNTYTDVRPFLKWIQATGAKPDLFRKF